MESILKMVIFKPDVKDSTHSDVNKRYVENILLLFQLIHTIIKNRNVKAIFVVLAKHRTAP
jgi:hypothetical protein